MGGCAVGDVVGIAEEDLRSRQSRLAPLLYSVADNFGSLPAGVARAEPVAGPLVEIAE